MWDKATVTLFIDGHEVKLEGVKFNSTTLTEVIKEVRFMLNPKEAAEIVTENVTTKQTTKVEKASLETAPLNESDASKLIDDLFN